MDIGYVFAKGQQVTGIESVSLATVTELLKLDKMANYYAVEGNAFYLPIKKPRELFIDAWGEENVELFYKCAEYDILHSFFPAYEHIKTHAKRIITVHDVIPMSNPEWFLDGMREYFDVRIRASLQISDKIIAVSEYTKLQILKYYSIPENRIVVVPNGMYNKFVNCKPDYTIVERLSLNQDYILSVCTVEPRKNLKGLIEAFSLYKSRSKSDIKLVIVGRAAHDYDLLDFLKVDSTFRNDIITAGYVTDSELVALYHYAKAVAYVSFCEGFGLPILEGLKFGKAVIASNTSSLPEVGGDAVAYCDPYNIESIEETIENVIENNAYRTDLENKAEKRANLFSYELTAQKVLNIYKEVLRC